MQTNRRRRKYTLIKVWVLPPNGPSPCSSAIRTPKEPALASCLTPAWRLRGWVGSATSRRGGNGYISGGPANRSTDEYLGATTSFSERIPHLAAKYDPDIVVLDGGRNDTFPPREDVYMAMRDTIADARRAWPDAQIVFVRPRYLADPGDDLGFDANFMARLESEPAAAGVLFIDPIASLVGTDTSALLSDDGVHPNPRGYRELGSALVDSLTKHDMAGGAS